MDSDIVDFWDIVADQILPFLSFFKLAKAVFYHMSPLAMLTNTIFAENRFRISGRFSGRKNRETGFPISGSILSLETWNSLQM